MTATAQNDVVFIALFNHFKTWDKDRLTVNCQFGVLVFSFKPSPLKN